MALVSVGDLDGGAVGVGGIANGVIPCIRHPVLNRDLVHGIAAGIARLLR